MRFPIFFFGTNFTSYPLHLPHTKLFKIRKFFFWKMNVYYKPSLGRLSSSISRIHFPFQSIFLYYPIIPFFINTSFCYSVSVLSTFIEKQTSLLRRSFETFFEIIHTHKKRFFMYSTDKMNTEWQCSFARVHERDLKWILKLVNLCDSVCMQT